MTRCRRCNKPLKERAVSDTFEGPGYRVVIAGIPAIVCSHCGYQGVHADTLDEIEMFTRPLLSGGLGMHMLASGEITIDLGHPQYASAIDIADRPFPEGPVIEVAAHPGAYGLDRLELHDSPFMVDSTLAGEEARAA